MKIRFVVIVLLSSLLLGFTFFQSNLDTPRIVSHIVDLKTSELALYHLDHTGKPLGDFTRLKSHIESKGKVLQFAMNAGMYLQDQSPQGWFIEDGKEIKPINLKSSTYGNFYMKPNGVFAIDNKNTPLVFTTEDHSKHNNLKYATQSGPMLVIKGELHPKFNKGSKNVHIRNGVGVLPDGKLLFAMSKERINFYDFATFFKENGCLNALYLDGFVSRLYLPEKGYFETNSRFGVMIGETIDKK